MEEAGKRGLVIDFTLEEIALDGSIFRALLGLIADAPNTTYVIEHLANPPGTDTSAAALSAWTAALRGLAGLPNVSSLPTQCSAPFSVLCHSSFALRHKAHLTVALILLYCITKLI